LKPLSWGGLWLAVMTAPQSAPSQRTVKLSCGVERGPSKMWASPPSFTHVEAASRQKEREKWRTSCARTSRGRPARPCAARWRWT
jgi:hypothetical protein